MASILNSQSCDLKHGVTVVNHCEVIIVSMKCLERLKDQAKNLVYKMSLNEIDFHLLFDGILNVEFSFVYGLLHGKWADFSAKKGRCISSYVIQPSDRSPDHPRYAEWYPHTLSVSWEVNQSKCMSQCPQYFDLCVSFVVSVSISYL